MDKGAGLKEIGQTAYPLDARTGAMVAGNVVPIYEYECQSCHKVFEYMQRMSEDRKTECEECKGALERIISQSAFHLKGGGWYKDLYSSVKKDGDGKGGASADSSSGSSSSDSSSKSTPAASSTSSTPAAAPDKAKSSGSSD